MIEKLIEHLSELDDPRCPGKVEHQLIDILVIAVCAVIACAESWEDIALYGRSKQDWLRRFLALPNGVPSHDTFRRVFMLIDPDAFEACFTAWAQGIALAKQRGAYKGRKQSLSQAAVAQLRERLTSGISKAQVAREFGISRQTLYQYLREGEDTS